MRAYARPVRSGDRAVWPRGAPPPTLSVVGFFGTLAALDAGSVESGAPADTRPSFFSRQESSEVDSTVRDDGLDPTSIRSVGGRYSTGPSGAGCQRAWQRCYPIQNGGDDGFR